MTSFTDRAKSILASAEVLDSYIASIGRSPASFDVDSLHDLPEEIESVRNSLIDEAQTIKRLALGSSGIHREILFAVGSKVLFNSRSLI